MQTCPSLPPLTAVRAFEAAARLGSFTRAADELNMTAAAVSYQIKQLEKRLGLVLFRRHSRRVELTSSGEQIAPFITSAFDAMRAAFAQAVDRSQSDLAVTALPTVGSSWLAPRLGGFNALHPDIAVRLDMSVSVADLTGPDMDVAVRSGLGQWPGMRTHFLLPNLFTPVCSPSLREAARALDNPDQPFGFPILGRPAWWARWYAGMGRGPVDLEGRFGVNFGAEHLYVTAAIAGHGVAMVSPIFFRRELESGAVVAAHDLVVGDGRGYWLTYPTTQAASPKIRAFRDWITAEAEREMRDMRPVWDRAVKVAAE